jgi:hypothetical protein
LAVCRGALDPQGAAARSTCSTVASLALLGLAFLLFPQRTERACKGRSEREGAMDIDRKAPVITRDGIVIAAPLSSIWELHTDIAAWPTWNTAIDRASIDRPLAVGAVFRWSTAGLEMISTVRDLVTQERMGWSGSVQGITDIHVWRFRQLDREVLVQTEESWDGEVVRHNRDRMQQARDRSLRAWVLRLKEVAEEYYPRDSTSG